MSVEDLLNTKLNQPNFKPLTYYETKIAQEHLVPIVSILLKQAGWDDEFCIKMDANGKLSLYLRVAYVAACSIEGYWDSIKEKIPELIEYANIMRKLRKFKGINIQWIDRSLKDFPWTK